MHPLSCLPPNPPADHRCRVTTADGDQMALQSFSSASIRRCRARRKRECPRSFVGRSFVLFGVQTRAQQIQLVHSHTNLVSRISVNGLNLDRPVFFLLFHSRYKLVTTRHVLCSRNSAWFQIETSTTCDTRSATLAYLGFVCSSMSRQPSRLVQSLKHTYEAHWKYARKLT